MTFVPRAIMYTVERKQEEAYSEISVNNEPVSLMLSMDSHWVLHPNMYWRPCSIINPR
jgi:hypothetical protein